MKNKIKSSSVKSPVAKVSKKKTGLCLTVEEIRQKLAQANVQPTIQRVAICKYVLCEADHPTAEQVLEWSVKHLGQISQATVYNTLNTLLEAGILRTYKMPHMEKIIYDNNLENHFHLLDESTGMIVDIPEDEVQIHWKDAEKFKINSYELVIRTKSK